MYLERMKALIDRRTRLTEAPARPSGWVTEETGQTYAEAWAEDGQDRRKLLADAAIRFVLNSGNPLNTHLYVPQDRVPITD